MSAAIKNLIKSPLSLYVTTTCPFCKGARKLATEQGVKASVVELDKEKDGSTIRNELTEITGQKTVPYVFSNGDFLGGYTDLSKKPSDFWDSLRELQKKA